MEEQAALKVLLEGVPDGEFRFIVLFKHDNKPYVQGTKDTIANALNDPRTHVEVRLKALGDSFLRRVRLNLEQASLAI